MIMINKFDEFNIHEIYKEYGIENYTINNGLVDVDGDVYLSNMELDILPVRFGIVARGFDCNFNKLTSLKGAPKQVGEIFIANIIN